MIIDIAEEKGFHILSFIVLKHHFLSDYQMVLSSMLLCYFLDHEFAGLSSAGGKMLSKS